MTAEKALVEAWGSFELAVTATLLALAAVGAWHLARKAFSAFRRAWGARTARKRVIPAGTVMTKGADGRLRPWKPGRRAEGTLVMGEDSTTLLRRCECCGNLTGDRLCGNPCWGWPTPKLTSYPTPEVDPTVVWVVDRYDDQRKTDAEIVACPICGAAVGASCQVGVSDVGENDGYHLAREIEARRTGMHRLDRPYGVKP